MPLYEVGVIGAAAATGAAYSDLHGATTGAPRIREFGAFCNAATASPGWLGRPANTPVASTNTIGVAVNPDSDVASITNAGTAWSTAPTTPTIIFRRWNLPATIGAGIVFVWDLGEEILLSKTAGSNQWLIHWNPTGGATGSAHNTFWKWRE